MRNPMKKLILWVIVVMILSVNFMQLALAEEGTANPYIEISTQYPSITVKSGDSLTFDLDIENQTGASQDIALSVVSMPEGWSGTFSASGRETALVHIKSENTNSEIDFNLDIPLETENGRKRVSSVRIRWICI